MSYNVSFILLFVVNIVENGFFVDFSYSFWADNFWVWSMVKLIVAFGRISAPVRSVP